MSIVKNMPARSLKYIISFTNVPVRLGTASTSPKKPVCHMAMEFTKNNA
jgi:hypothetical protein